MDESLKALCRVKETNQRGYILYESTEIIWRRQNYIDRRQISAARGWQWGKGTECKGALGNLVGDGSILRLDCGGGYTTVHISQNSSTANVKSVSFPEHKSCRLAVWKCKTLLSPAVSPKHFPEPVSSHLCAPPRSYLPSRCLFVNAFFPSHGLDNSDASGFPLNLTFPKRPFSLSHQN